MQVPLRRGVAVRRGIRDREAVAGTCEEFGRVVEAGLSKCGGQPCDLLGGGGRILVGMPDGKPRPDL